MNGLGGSMYVGLFAIIFIELSLVGCSQVPVSLDTSTYLTHKAKVEEQQKRGAFPLVGIYRVGFRANALVENPEQAEAINGDWQVACLERGVDLDFISLSGITGYGPMSDQGGSFSVNLQGSTLWSFSLKALNTWPSDVRGKSTGVLEKRGPRDAVLSRHGDTLLRILVEPTEAQRATEAKLAEQEGRTPAKRIEVFFLSPIH